MSVYRRKNRKGWYVNFVCNGIRINRFGGRTKKEALQLEWEIRRNIALYGAASPDAQEKSACHDEILFGAVAKEYLGYIRDTKSARTYDLENGDYKNHLEEFFSDMKLSELSTDVIMDFQARKKKQGYANRTVNLHVGLVRKVLKFAMDKGYIRNIRTKFPMLREAKKQHAFLNPLEYEKLKDYISYDLALKRVVFARNTGMRPAELTYLTWSDIDFELRIANIQSKKEWKIKTDEERTIHLNDVAMQVLRELYPKRKSKWVFSNTDKPVKSIRRVLSTAAKKAGLRKKVSPNMLRHTFATHALCNGADLNSLMAILGHKNIETTNRYLHAIQENHKRTVKLLEDDSYCKKRLCDASELLHLRRHNEAHEQ